MSREDGLLDPEALTRLEEWGGKELVGKMLELFLEVATERMDAIRSGVLENDRSRIERGAHSLRSSAGNVGAESVRVLAARMEALAPDGDEASLRATLDQLEDRFRRTLEELRELKGSEPT
jgi:two-component system, sensor histidine kinase and response regulator